MVVVVVVVVVAFGIGIGVVVAFGIGIGVVVAFGVGIGVVVAFGVGIGVVVAFGAGDYMTYPSEPKDWEWLDKIAEREKKATLGPWSYDLDEEEIHSDTMQDSSGDPAHIVFQLGVQKNDNAAFIAHSRFDIPNLLTAIRAMKEALEEVSVVYYEASSKITEDHLKGHIMFGTNPEKQKIIDDHNRRAWVGIKTLARLSSEDFHE